MQTRINAHLPSAQTFPFLLHHIPQQDPTTLTELGYPSPWWPIPAYNNPLHHNVMPASYRMSLFTLCVANVATVVLFEYVVILGPVREFIRRRWGKAKKHMVL